MKLVVIFSVLSLLVQVKADPSKTCRGEKTLSVNKDRILLAKDWLKFTKKNSFFVIGVTDSTCEACCENEWVLRELENMSQNGTLVYEQKRGKKK